MDNLQDKIASLGKRLGKLRTPEKVTPYHELRAQYEAQANSDIATLQAQSKQQRIASIFGQADLNPNWRFDSLLNDADDMNEAISFAQSFISAYDDPNFREQSSHMFIFYGDYGRGKSHLAGAIAHHLIEHFETSVLYRQLSSLLEMRFYSYDYDAKDGVAEQFREIQQDLLNVDLLILDEVCVNETMLKKNAQSWLGNLLRLRQAAKKNCILITNHTLKDLSVALGKYCTESIKEYDTYKIPFQGPSRREEFVEDSVSYTPVPGYQPNQVK